MKHVVFFSGGACSYCAAKRVVERYGVSETRLLFTDTKIEDEDCYRFIEESAKKLGVELIKIADGRTPFEVYRDKRFLGNNRVASCSHELKQKTARDYIFGNYDPSDTVLYLGLDWSETHRYAAPRRNWSPFRVEYPMGDAPYLSKIDMLEILKADGLEVPRMYKMGFAHNNCGGFCCRAGQGHFAKLLEHFPERYAYAEAQEQYMREMLKKDVSFMKKSVNGIARPYTLKQLREDINARREVDMFDIGGCGCFVEDDNEKT